MTKHELRKIYRNKRKALSVLEIENLSLDIANQLLSMPIWRVSFYHLFLSIKKQKEVDTEGILHILNGKDKNIIISKSDFSSMKMTHFLLTDATKLKENAWGIPEPIAGIEIAPQQIEVVFIPLLAFDKKGNRLGYGKGFYDRFLQNCKNDVLKIGLSFFEAEQEITDISEKDVPLNYCVTPKRIYRF